MAIKGLEVDSDVDTSKDDALGGGGNFIKNTGLYGVIIDLAYLGMSAGGAASLNLHLKVASDKTTVRQTLWITSGNAKGNKNYYITRDGKKNLLPGMSLANQIAKITTGKPLSELDQEEKVVNLYDFTAKAEKPTKVPVLTELVGKPLLAAIVKVETNKVASNGAGGYNKLADRRQFNELDKVFYPEDGSSVTEKLAKSEPLVHKQWQTKFHSDYVRDNYEAVAETSLNLGSEATTAASISSLFGE